ncbi:tape measure protein [Acinetobacter sp. AOR34_HL]|uniref:tape measure protein n=1 Tax=Acinetobacter sp. AOR34_HL TaxID=2919384 RepID=UPI0022EB889C|nr:tape measure protein [Acinetobacter sp. AOR34_HL]MDA3500715.1 tape measure protein [Acinetobacter sp. AOR34_HL]
MAKELVFKVVMQGDTNNFDTSVKKSKQTAEQMFQAIGTAVEELEKKTKKSSDSTKNIISTDAQDRVKDLTAELNAATNVIVAMGDKSSISANEIRSMSQQSQQAISSLKDELVAAQAEYLQLSQAQASPQYIGETIAKITDIKRAIRDVETAFGTYQTVAANAMTGVANATSITITEIQKFTSVDLTAFVSEAQNATRAIHSMGDGAVVSTKDVERIGQLGSTAIDSLTRELNSARQAWENLSNTNGIDLDELVAAKNRVDGLERALSLTETSMDEFRGAVSQATPILDQFDDSVDSTNQELKETGTLSEKAAQGLQDLQNTYGLLTTVLAGLGIGVTASELAQTSDEFKNLEGRIKIAVGEAGNFESALDGVVEVALATNSNLIATGDLFATLTRATKDLKTTTDGVVTDYKLSQAQILQLTETINQSIKVSGASAQASEAAIVQFAQAIGSSVLRGDELNSIIEQAPRLAQALADGLDVPIGKLKELGESGQLSADVVIKALRQQSEIIEAEYKKLPMTVGSAIENLKTSWMVYIGELDKSNGISENVAKAIKYIADNLDQLVSTLTFAAQAFVAYKALGMAAIFLEKANSVRAASIAIQQETVALTTNTQAQLINANAARANAAAHTGVQSAASNLFPTFTKAAGGMTTLLSRFGAYGIAAAAVVTSGSLIADMFVKTGEAIGENVAKLWLKITGEKSLEQSEKDLAAQQEESKKKQQELAEAREKAALKSEMLKNAALGLNEVSKATVAEFDKQIKAGEQVSVVLENIAKSFNFDSSTGINNAITALTALQTQGKITGEQVRATISDSLKGIDLSEFQGKLAAIPVNLEKQIEEANSKVKAKQKELDDWKKNNADMNYKQWTVEVSKYQTDIDKLQAKSSALQVQYANSVRSAADVQGAILDEAIRRTGLSYEELEGKSTKAFQSALSDVKTIINGMDDLKDRGVDVGRALDASISNAISTATNQKEIDDLKAKIINLRSTLGEKVADGLLQQAEQQLINIQKEADKTQAGINSVAEAFGKFGLQTKAEASIAAKSYMDAFSEMERSGQATSGQLKQALIKMTDEIYNSGDAAKVAWYESKLSAYDLKSSIDDLGNTSVKTMNDIGNSARFDAANGFRELGRVAREEAKSTADEWIDAMAKVDAKRKAQAAETAKGLGQLADGQNQMAQNFYDQLIAGGMEKGRAEELKNESITRMNNQLRTALNGGSASGAFDAKIGRNESQAWMQEILDGLDSKGSIGSSSPKISAPNIEAPSIQQFKMPNIDIGSPKNVRIELVNGNNSTTVYGDEQEADFTEKFFRELEQAKKRM